MPTLRIQHEVTSYEAWKSVFDNDPVGRKDGGVLRYRVDRAVDAPNFVMIDLEFADVEHARAFLGRLQQLWDGPGRVVMQSPQAWIVETAESGEV